MLHPTLANQNAQKKKRRFSKGDASSKQHQAYSLKGHLSELHTKNLSNGACLVKAASLEPRDEPAAGTRLPTETVGEARSVNSVGAHLEDSPTLPSPRKSEIQAAPEFSLARKAILPPRHLRTGVSESVEQKSRINDAENVARRADAKRSLFGAQN